MTATPVTTPFYVVKYTAVPANVEPGVQHYNTLLDAKMMAKSFIDKGYTKTAHVYSIAYAGSMHFGKPPVKPVLPPMEFIWTPHAYGMPTTPR